MYWRRSSATIRAGFSRSCQSNPPDPADANNGPISGSSGGEGVVADAEGIIYSAEVGPRAVKRYVRYIDP